MRFIRSVRWGTSVLIVVGAGIGLIQFRVALRLDLTCGTVVYRHCDTVNYQWLSDHELLILKPSLDANTGVYRGCKAFRNDVLTCCETSLPRLDGLFSNAGNGPCNEVISPNGHWLLWRGKGGIYATEINGTRLQKWDDQSFVDGVTTRYMQWRSDSRHFIELQRQQPTSGNAALTAWSAVVRSVDRPTEAIKVRLPVLPELDAWSYYEEPYITGADKLFSCAPALEESTQKKLLTVALSADAVPSKRIVKAPNGLYFATIVSLYDSVVAISPHGDRIAWLCGSQPYVSPIYKLFGRFFPRLRRPYRRFSLWLSNADGSAMHELGATEAPMHDDSPKWEGVTDVRWLPGGKRLSYQYKDTLYTIAVD